MSRSWPERVEVMKRFSHHPEDRSSYRVPFALLLTFAAIKHFDDRVSFKQTIINLNIFTLAERKHLFSRVPIRTHGLVTNVKPWIRCKIHSMLSAASPC